MVDKDSVKSITIFFNAKKLVSWEYSKVEDYWIESNLDVNNYRDKTITKYKDGMLYKIGLIELDSLAVGSLTITKYESNAISLNTIVFKNFLKYDPKIEPWDFDTSQIQRRIIDTYSIQDSKFHSKTKIINIDRPESNSESCYKDNKFPLIYFY